jgi:hypothetical protein
MASDKNCFTLAGRSEILPPAGETGSATLWLATRPQSMPQPATANPARQVNPCAINIAH